MTIRLAREGLITLIANSEIYAHADRRVYRRLTVRHEGLRVSRTMHVGVLGRGMMPARLHA